MSTPGYGPAPRVVLTHLAWLRGRARCLIPGPGEAEELVQAIWFEAASGNRTVG